MNTSAFTLAAVLVGGIASGAGGMYVLGPQRVVWETWLYRSDHIAIDPTGKAVIQPGYDRETEALKLLDAYRQVREQFVEPVCRLTEFTPPAHGVIKINPGLAIPRRWGSPVTEEEL